MPKYRKCGIRRTKIAEKTIVMFKETRRICALPLQPHEDLTRGVEQIPVRNGCARIAPPLVSAMRLDPPTREANNGLSQHARRMLLKKDNAERLQQKLQEPASFHEYFMRTMAKNEELAIAIGKRKECSEMLPYIRAAFSKKDCIKEKTQDTVALLAVDSIYYHMTHKMVCAPIESIA